MVSPDRTPSWPWDFTNSSCSRGTRGDTVKALQQKLGTGTDGQLSPGTERAVRYYQQKNGLKVEGMAGPATPAHMKLFPQVTTDTVKASQGASLLDPGRGRCRKCGGGRCRSGRAPHLGHHKECLRIVLPPGLPVEVALHESFLTALLCGPAPDAPHEGIIAPVETREDFQHAEAVMHRERAFQQPVPGFKCGGR